MPRFVILRHELPDGSERPTHWDFMLEHGDILRTWALTESPDIRHEIQADELADHRLSYLDYEGPISGNRGCVSRWDTGEFLIASESPDELTFQLRGARLNGTATLRRQMPNPQRWIFAFSDCASSAASRA